MTATDKDIARAVEARRILMELPMEAVITAVGPEVCRALVKEATPEAVVGREADEERIIQRLGEIMRYKLRLRRERGDWRSLDVWTLIGRIEGEVAELNTAVHDGTQDEMREEAADVANYCAMLIDKLDGGAG